MIPQVRPVGPAPAKIMVVGEAPGQNEVRAGEPFVGASGKELTNMLHDAGIMRTECFVTNVARVQPPRNDISKFYVKNTNKVRIAGDELYEGIVMLREEIQRVQPNVIIALGDTALWALTNQRGITKWRGSIVECTLVEGYKVVPTYHPAAVLRKWDWRFIAVQDMRRAEKESHYREIKYPDYQFIVRPSFEQVMRTLDRLLEMADGVENRGKT